MITLEDRQSLAWDIEVAHQAGARLHRVCQIGGIAVRTLQRWKLEEGLVCGDGPPQALHPTPCHALTTAEREHVLQVANEERFADVPPAPGQNAHRGRARARARAPRPRRAPTTHVASTPREAWCRDMTYLLATVVGRWFYLHLILDLYSRKIVGR